jgi:hypothetical protein
LHIRMSMDDTSALAAQTENGERCVSAMVSVR